MRIFKRESSSYRRMTQALDDTVLEEKPLRSMADQSVGEVVRTLAMLVLPGYTVRRCLNWTFRNDTTNPALTCVTYACEALKLSAYALLAQPTYESISALLGQ